MPKHNLIIDMVFYDAKQNGQCLARSINTCMLIVQMKNKHYVKFIFKSM